MFTPIHSIAYLCGADPADSWKHHYISEGIMNVLDQALINSSATTTTHATILKLDQKIRSCAIPLKLKLNPETRATADEMAILQYYVAIVSPLSDQRLIATQTFSVMPRICYHVPSSWLLCQSSLRGSD